MKGAVFINLAKLVEQEFGLDVWDKVLEEVKPESEGIYTSTLSYSDEELLAIVASLSKHTQVEVPQLLVAFGQYLFKQLMTMAPQEAKEAENLFEFLNMVETIIHVEVKKLYEDANLPSFECEESDKQLEMVYRSPRKLCHLSEGLILGAAEHFSEKVKVSQPVCMHQGGDHCVLQIVKD